MQLFPIKFGSKKNMNSTLSRTYVNNLTGRYAWSINIIHHNWKRWRRLLQFSFFKFTIALCIIITINLVTWLDSLAFLAVKSFHKTKSDCMYSRVNPHSIVAWMLRNSLLEASAKSEGEKSGAKLTFRQLYRLDSLWHAYVTWQQYTVKCTVQISTQNTAQSFGQLGQMVECSFKN